LEAGWSGGPQLTHFSCTKNTTTGEAPLTKGYGPGGGEKKGGPEELERWAARRSRWATGREARERAQVRLGFGFY
jgi:hypothetical protein